MVRSATLSTVLSRTTTSRETTSTPRIVQRRGWPPTAGVTAAEAWELTDIRLPSQISRRFRLVMRKTLLRSVLIRNGLVKKLCEERLGAPGNTGPPRRRDRPSHDPPTWAAEPSTQRRSAHPQR